VLYTFYIHPFYTFLQVAYTLTSAIHPLTRRRISISEALKAGIIDPTDATYTNLASGEVIPLGQAVERGLVNVDPEGLPRGTGADLTRHEKVFFT